MRVILFLLLGSLSLENQDIVVCCRCDWCFNPFLASKILSSADNALICKHFRPRPRLTQWRSWSGSKPYDTLILFLKEFFEKLNLEESQQKATKAWKITQHVKCYDNGEYGHNGARKIVQYHYMYLWLGVFPRIFLIFKVPIRTAADWNYFVLSASRQSTWKNNVIPNQVSERSYNFLDWLLQTLTHLVGGSQKWC